MLTEKLSALIDGELDKSETDALLERMRHDPEFRAEWTRQHYMRLAMFENPPETVASGFADQVMARIAAEAIEFQAVSPPVRPTRRPAASVRARRRGWTRPVTGLAMAASVAAVAVLAVDYTGGIGGLSSQTGSANTATAAASAPHAEQVARSESDSGNAVATVASTSASASEGGSDASDTTQAQAHTMNTASRTFSRFGAGVFTRKNPPTFNDPRIVRLMDGRQTSWGWNAKSLPISEHLLFGHGGMASAKHVSGMGPEDRSLEMTADTSNASAGAHTTSTALSGGSQK